MSADTALPTGVRPWRSLFFTCTLLVVVCVVAVAAAMETRLYLEERAHAQKVLAERAEEVSRLLGMQLGGSIRFANIEALDEIVSATVLGAGQDALGAAVYDATGALQFQTGSERLDTSLMQSYATEVLESRESVLNDEVLIKGIPVYFGEGSDLVGVVVTAWTAEFALAAVSARQQSSLLAGAVMLLMVLVPAAGFLRWWMSKPLTRLEQSLLKIARGEYDSPVPHTERADEIGSMAVGLEKVRAALLDARELSRETDFKSTAFVGSSSPLMMVDESYDVIFVNPACEALVGEIMPELAEKWPGVPPESLVGSRLSNLQGIEDCISAVQEEGAAGDVSAETDLRLGRRTVRIVMNPARDKTGQMIGCVIEWTDRTEEQRNAALLDAFNTNLIRLEYDLDGKLVDANRNFLELIGASLAETSNCNLSAMFKGNVENDADGTVFLQKVLEGEIAHGRFSMFSALSERHFVFDGSFALLRSESGENEGVIFLASDVTEQAASLKEAEAARENNAREQERVVAVLGRALTTLSDGDLDADITEDVPEAYVKLREDFNDTVNALRTAIVAVVQNSDSIRNETAEITSAADDLSRRTEKQAATLEETAAALDELTVSVKSTAEGADGASTMSAEAQKNAEQGGAVAREAVAAMDGIKTSSQEISKITSVIDDIAFQTNLLALNAGVEAARAGEAGRGFAVVATEVRALAQRSSDAAREINALISSSGEQVQQGVDLVDRTGAALDSIVTSVSEISQRVSAIAGSAREQSSGLAEINSAVNELDHVTQQNAAMFEETTAASHALTSEADALAAAVSQFKLEGVINLQPAAEVEPEQIPVAAAVPAAATDGSAAFDISEMPQEDGWEEF